MDRFWLGPYISGKNLVQTMLMWRRAQKLLSSDLKSDIRAAYPLQDAPRAVEEYDRKMTGGKVLLRPNA